jgi:hypothetical protein
MRRCVVHKGADRNSRTAGVISEPARYWFDPHASRNAPSRSNRYSRSMTTTRQVLLLLIVQLIMDKDNDGDDGDDCGMDDGRGRRHDGVGTSPCCLIESTAEYD